MKPTHTHVMVGCVIWMLCISSTYSDPTPIPQEQAYKLVISSKELINCEPSTEADVNTTEVFLRIINGTNNSSESFYKNSIESITLYRVNILGTEEGAFKGFANIKMFTIRKCPNDFLPVDFFKDLTELELLDLSENHFLEFDDHTFPKLLNLKELDLSSNKLTFLKESLFMGLINLEKLFLQKNQIRELPKDIFKNLPSLKRLGVHKNKLTKISKNNFKGLFELEYLGVDGNKIAFIEEDSFIDLKVLDSLDLSGNQLDSLNDNTFNGLVKLYYLYLRHNKINSVTSGTFRGLSDLHTISFNDNELTVLPKGLFNNLPNLKYLYLDNNKLQTIEGVFANVHPIDTVTLTKNPFTQTQSIAGILALIPNVESIQIDECPNYYEIPIVVESRKYESRQCSWTLVNSTY